MSRYRKVDPRIWNDERFRTFSDDGQLAFLFLMTHPTMTCLGAMRATLEGLAAEKGWPVKRLREALGPAIESGMVECNQAAAYIGLRRFLKYNEPEGPNSVSKAWREALDLIPECDQRRALVARCRAYLDSRSEDFRKKIPQAAWDAFPDGIGHGIPDGISDAKRDASPIQEQEQEQEQESPYIPPGGHAKGNGFDREAAEAIAYMNERAGTSFRPTAKENLQAARARLRDGFRLEDLKAVIRLKVSQWRDNPEMSGYLRPVTLFRLMYFEGYLQEAKRATTKATSEKEARTCTACGEAHFWQDGKRAEPCPADGGGKRGGWVKAEEASSMAPGDPKAISPPPGRCTGVSLPAYVEGTDTLKRVPCPYCEAEEGLPLIVEYERGLRRAWNCGACGSRWFIERVGA